MAIVGLNAWGQGVAERRSCEARRANFFEGNFSDSLQGWFFPGIVLQGWLFRDGLAPLNLDILIVLLRMFKFLLLCYYVSSYYY